MLDSDVKGSVIAAPDGGVIKLGDSYHDTPRTLDDGTPLGDNRENNEIIDSISDANAADIQTG